MKEPPRQTYKALLLDYDWIFSLDTSECSVCLTQRQAQAILGMVDYIGWHTRWQSTGEIDRLLIEELADDLARRIMSGCGNEYSQAGWDAHLQQNNIINQLRQSNYTGTTTSINPNAPTTNFNGDNSPERNTALCMAVRAYVEVKLLETLNLYRVQLSLAALAAGIAGWLGGPLGALGGGIAVIITGLALAQIESAAADREAIDDVICDLYESMKGTSITEANFQSKINALANGTGNRDTIVQILKNGRMQRANYLHFVDLLGEAYVQALAGADDCPCDESGWCYEFNFLGGLQSWTLENNTTFSSGFVCQNIFQGSTSTWYKNAQAVRAFTSTTITKITVTYDRVAGFQGTTDNNRAVAIENGVSPFTLLAQKTMGEAGSGTDLTLEWTGSTALSSVRVRLDSSRATSGQGSGALTGSGKITKVRFEGLGVNPFGADNCS